MNRIKYDIALQILKQKSKPHTDFRKAVKDSRIIKPLTCSLCPNDGRIEGHHYNGYENPYDVIWLCKSCLMKIHGAERRLKSYQAKCKIYRYFYPI